MDAVTLQKLEEIRQRLEAREDARLEEAALPLKTAFGNLSLVLERMSKDLKIASNMTAAMLKRVK